MMLGHVSNREYIEDIVYIWCWDMCLEEIYRKHDLHMVSGLIKDITSE